MERFELMDKMEEIQRKNYSTHKGSNEADLMTREDIADLFFKEYLKLKLAPFKDKKLTLAISDGIEVYAGDNYFTVYHKDNIKKEDIERIIDHLKTTNP